MGEDHRDTKATHDEQSTTTDVTIDVIGARIRQLREARGRSLAEVAQRTGLSPAQLEAVENGKKDPTFTELDKIAASLDIPLRQLFSSLSPAAVVTAVLFEDAPPNIQDAIKTILDPSRGSA